MRRIAFALISTWLCAAGAALGAEGQTLSLYAAQGLRSAEVTATGRATAQYMTRVGSRLSAPIVEWGKNEAGEPLDVGMPVKAGQMLFSIDRSTFKAKADAAQAALDSAQAALDDLLAPMRKERVDAFRASVAELEAVVKDREREETRYRQLVEVDRAQPVTRLEQAQLELEQARNQLKAAQARLDEALAGPTPTEVAIAKARVKEAQAMLDSTQLDLRDTAVTAPFDGTITRRLKGLGDYVSGAPFVEVIEVTTVDRLEAELRLPEAYLARVAAGKTRLTLHSPLMQHDLDLAVTRVVPNVDPEHGTFAVRVVIPSEERSGLVPGAFVTATLALGDQGGGVVVPQRAVLTEAGKNYVMVAGDKKMQRRDVEVGDRLTEGIIVKSGLQAGEKVLVGPADQLKDGAPLPEGLVEQSQ